MPSIWLSIYDLVHVEMHASEVVKLAVQRTHLVTRVAVEAAICSTPETTINLEGQSAPHYEIKISISTNDGGPQSNFPALEKENTCSIMAKLDIRHPIAGVNLKTQIMERFAQKARKTSEKYKKRDRAHMVELTTEGENSEVSISPSNRFEDDHDDVVTLLQAIIDEIDIQ
ncbi:hypothetical protein OnM2_050001b [Erysiphe neolycopersici]|uniref:Uncharacterized protein n=1 Tax=Erysiphe neolycopersici TaxID=212602 RepID=A0A420HSX1_9PEZI|nr:hypothetical protein OnM2_050001b [Erysiphe neolycopersici]